MLRIEQARVSFGATSALDGVDLVVKPAERVAVLGPSGSGKSTLLRAVAGLQPLDAGAVVIDGVDVVDVPPHRRGVGLMFQDGLLFPHLSVRDNVGYGLRIRGVDVPARNRRSDELLAMVGLPAQRFADRAVTALSGGEQQRVALARTLAPEPQVLLLDEPFGSLDAVLRGRLVDDVRDLTRTLGMTVVAVTHDRSEAFAFADRIAVMDAGRIVQCATPEEVWQAPASELVARLVGMAVVDAVALRLGHTGSFGVRPSGLRIVEEQHTDTELRGTVEERAATGDTVRLTVLLDGAGPRDRRRVLVAAPAERAVVRGTRVGVVVPPDAVVGLPGTGG
jgi:thiamine transport system ATP-binding protein